jgi:mono/diheme cytochrome c family protein
MTWIARLAGWSLAALLGFGLLQVVLAQETQKAKPKHAIKEVMRGAHVAPEGGKSLLARVAAGGASDDEKRQLLDFYISLVENEPPRGEASEFRKKAGAAALVAAKVIVGREGAAGELTRAVNCAACHRDHKPPTQ